MFFLLIWIKSVPQAANTIQNNIQSEIVLKQQTHISLNDYYIRLNFPKELCVTWRMKQKKTKTKLWNERTFCYVLAACCQLNLIFHFIGALFTQMVITIKCRYMWILPLLFLIQCCCCCFHLWNIISMQFRISLAQNCIYMKQKKKRKTVKNGNRFNIISHTVTHMHLVSQTIDALLHSLSLSIDW